MHSGKLYIDHICNAIGCSGPALWVRLVPPTFPVELMQAVSTSLGHSRLREQAGAHIPPAARRGSTPGSIEAHMRGVGLVMPLSPPTGLGDVPPLTGCKVLPRSLPRSLPPCRKCHGSPVNASSQNTRFLTPKNAGLLPLIYLLHIQIYS